jgi:asparagine synthase (glutamine-hydrolysing)
MNDVGNDPLLNFSSYDVHSYLCGDILYKVDMASMHTSLEVREPFLDHRILEFAASMPAQFKINGNSGKWIVKQILGDLSPEDMFNRPKQGFSIPLEKWCRNELKPLFMEMLSDQKIAQSGVFNHESVIKIRNAFVNNRPMDFQRLFRIFSFLLWQKHI